MSRKLSDLCARFVDSVSGAKGVGVRLACPCGNSDPDHDLYVPFSVALDGSPGSHGEKGWTRTGDTIDTLTLVPSVRRIGGCDWHGWIRNGEAVS